MHPVEILEKISQEASSNTNKTIIAIYREAFNSSNDIELFKLRALLMEQMERSLENTSKSKNTLQTFNDIYKALTHHSLTERIEKISSLISTAHIASAEAIFALHDFKQDFDAIDEISTLNDELKEIIETEEITLEQKKVILEICHDVDNAKFEHKITGNNAIKKLHENMFGKLILHKNIIESIKNIEIRKKLGEVYSKVEAVNKVMNTVASLANKAKDFIDLLPNGII
jgi:hypothetical protein